VRFIQDTGHRAPKYWGGRKPRDDLLDHPVVCVDWNDASAYAIWAGKRLPTKEEWEKAARGMDGRLYPWGNKSPTQKLCNFGDNVGGTTPVGQYSPQGDSSYGCVDMGGNIREWTASTHDKNYKIVCGGSWHFGSANVRCSYNVKLLATSLDRYGGFRCARSSE
jgi:formylglycine-generating enzyme required for sulfatase activity